MRIPGDITLYSLNNVKTDHGVKAVYTIQFKPINPISNRGSLVLTWPLQVTKPTTNPTVTIKPSQGSPLFSWNSQARSLTITKAFDLNLNTVNGFTIVIDGLVNPADNKVLNAFTLKTFDDEAQTYKIDQIKDNLMFPKTPCVHPCKSCLSAN